VSWCSCCWQGPAEWGWLLLQHAAGGTTGSASLKLCSCYWLDAAKWSSLVVQLAAQLLLQHVAGCTAVVVLQECLAVLAACGCTAEATGAFGIVAVLALACPLC
jgi:hypothetical protein